MHVQPLLCHRSTPTSAVAGIDVDVRRATNGRLQFRYALHGDLAHIALPAPAAAQHTDGLWRHTCFEAFISNDEGSDYLECNFSPSQAWAAYRFARYRTQMSTVVPRDPPRITLQTQGDMLTLAAELRLDEFAGDPLRIGLAAVIEETNRHISYWALRHPRAKPDFHHRAGFILRLAAPSPRDTET